MNGMEESFKVVGKVFSLLLENGLKRQGITCEAFYDGQEHPDSKEFQDHKWHLMDVLVWMVNEKLITGKPNQSFTTFHNAQLTAYGIWVARSATLDEEAGTSIVDYLNSNSGNLSGETYSKIGSLIGGIVGGAAQTLG